MNSRSTAMLPVAGENFSLPGADSLPFQTLTLYLSEPQYYHQAAAFMVPKM